LGVIGLVVILVMSTARWEPSLASVVTNFVIFGLAWVIGDNVQTRRAYVAELRDRADQAEQNQAERSQRAVEVERTRIARELHDLVAHSVSVMVVQAAGGGRALARDPEEAAGAFASIEATGREALNELRRLLGVLRDEGSAGVPPLTPAPSMRDLRALVSHYTEAGLPVSVEVQGAERDLPPAIDLSAYRIIQEALTNSLKHAGPAHAAVHVDYGEDCLEVTIIDDGRGAGAVNHGGLGLVGMRERVELFSGRLRTGPTPGGGYTVRVRLPLPLSGRS
jgi:signal transduction histidine kinase